MIEKNEIKVIMPQKKFDACISEMKEAEHVTDASVAQVEKWKESGKLIVIKDTQNIQIENWEVLGPKKMRKKFSKYKVFENPVYWGVDLSSEHEKYLTQFITKRPTILYNY